MAQRLCGYCRDIGHQRPKCPKLHEQRKDLHAHVTNELKRIYYYLCAKGLGPNALINSTVLRWGGHTRQQPILAQVLPYDYEVTRRYYNGNTYKSTYTSMLANDLYRTKNVKYSKQVNIRHMKYDHDSIYVHIPILLLDGSNNVELISIPLYQFYQGNLAIPTNSYAHAEGKEIIEKLFISPCTDTPELVWPQELLNPKEDFYPQRLQL